MLAMIRQPVAGTRTMEFTLSPQAASEVQKAIATFKQPAEAANPFGNTVKLSLDVGLREHLFNSEFKASVDFLSLINKQRSVEVSAKVARPDVSMLHKRVEGAAAGAALSAVLLAFKATRDAISNPALGALGLIALGATVWPSVGNLTFTLKPDGSVSTKIDFKMA
jgi:hypothetical protein